MTRVPFHLAGNFPLLYAKKYWASPLRIASATCLYRLPTLMVIWWTMTTTCMTSCLSRKMSNGLTCVGSYFLSSCNSKVISHLLKAT